MALVYKDYALPDLSVSFNFTSTSTGSGTLTALATAVTVPTTTGSFYAVPIVPITMKYTQTTGLIDEWALQASCFLYNASGSSVISWAAAYQQNANSASLLSNGSNAMGATKTFTTGMTQMNIRVYATRSSFASAIGVTASTSNGKLRVFWEAQSGSTLPGVSAYMDQADANRIITEGGATDKRINRIRYRFQGATTAGIFRGIPIGSKVTRYA